jgi:predicted acetyltransferase
MAREFEEHGDPRYAPAMADFAAYLRESAQFAAGSELPPDRVRMDVWWLVVDGELLGGSRLRHRLIPVLERDGGNIGYEVRPSMRGRGFGHRILALTLAKARRLPLSRVLLTSECDNHASARVIEAAGGVRDGRSTSPHTQNQMWRYRIDLALPYELRPALPEDRALVRELKFSGLRPYVEALWGWDDADQERRFGASFAPERQQIIRHEGRDVGMLEVEDRGRELFLAGIYVAEGRRNRGLGAVVLRDVLAGAAKPVTLRVLRPNPARGLYEGLGFRLTGETDTRFLMEWRPEIA